MGRFEPQDHWSGSPGALSTPLADGDLDQYRLSGQTRHDHPLTGVTNARSAPYRPVPLCCIAWVGRIYPWPYPWGRGIYDIPVRCDGSNGTGVSRISSRVHQEYMCQRHRPV